MQSQTHKPTATIADLPQRFTIILYGGEPFLGLVPNCSIKGSTIFHASKD